MTSLTTPLYDPNGQKKGPRRGFESDQHIFQMGPTGAKIKDGLIRKAKVRKSYGKIREKEPVVVPKYYAEQSSSEPEPAPASMELHPARQAMLDRSQESPVSNLSQSSHQPREKRPRRPKHAPFEKEARLVQQQKAAAQERREAAENVRLERQRKIEERERFRKAMTKARTGGKNGQRKLGRESKVLLERVRSLVAE
ncbi:MAG: hypothetical protein Q9181_005963 [Wetmoreana brouardii]